MSAPKQGRVLTHTLVVEADGPDDDSLTLECTTPDLCRGWVECHEEGHGPSPYETEDGDEDQEFHGVPHTWQHVGWTVDYTGPCIVNYCNWERPDDAPYPMRPGRYEVDVDWDDDPVLTFREPYRADS